MNILWLSHLVPYPPKGGVNQRSFNLMKEASKYHNIFIICFSQKSQQPTNTKLLEALEGLSSVGRIVEVYTFDSDQVQWKKVLLAIESLFTRDPYTVNWLKRPDVGPAIEKTISKNKIDLVHFDTISWAAYLEYVTNCKLVLNHHNIESHMMLRRVQNEKSIIKKMYYYQEGLKLKAYETKNCRLFNLNITCSVTDTNRLMKRMPGLRVDTIPNGVDLKYFQPSNIEHVENSLIFAGGLTWYPNIEAMSFFINDVWPKLIAVVPTVNMKVVGRNPPQWMLDFSKQENNFEVTGFVDDVRPYMNSAAVYVCPINDGGGTKLKILDALAMGKAIVAHPIACEGIDVVEGENVLFAETPGEYIEKICMLFDDEEMRMTLGSNGRKLIKEQYDFVKIGEKLSNLYTVL